MGMTGQPNRLGAGVWPMGGSAIDRTRPLQFRLDGRTFAAFAGDTVLSALLAAGVDAAGQRNGAPLALSARFAPAIIAATLAADQQRALAMARTLVTDGADYLTLAPQQRSTLFGRRRTLAGSATSLELDLAHAMPLPWRYTVGAADTSADVIVVGGGIAGLSAAMAAQQAGLSVILLEASPRLGGCARLFGSIEGEETPEAALARLEGAIADADGITVLTHAAVFAARPGAVRAHITDKASSMPAARVVDFQAPHIVLATGSSERLPLFAGNRLPGTVGVRECFELAQHYEVWGGQSALVATSSNIAYRLAMLASDAGIGVPRLTDARPEPQSRFIEFSKAYGITRTAGTIIAEAQRAPQGRGLAVTPRLVVGDFSRDEPVLHVDRLVVCGGWQPALDLWHMAGGNSVWNAAAARLEPVRRVPGVVLAGSAAGYLGLHACLASGPAAIDQLLDRPVTPVSELSVDPIYETPDGPAPVATKGVRTAATDFLDGGRSVIERPLAPDARARPWWRPVRAPRVWSLAEEPQAFGAADIAAAVQLGVVVPAEAGEMARERVGMVAMAIGAPVPLPATSAPLVPAFLAGRFGAAAQLWTIEPNDRRNLPPGALLQVNSDASDPAQAIGVVLQPGESGRSVVLVAADYAMAGRAIAVRQQSGATMARLIAPYPAP